MVTAPRTNHLVGPGAGALPDNYAELARKYPTEWKRKVTSNKPYLGAESYQAEDADLFFGRQRETSELVSLLLRGPLSVLHAPSGAGKSSLLNARVIPAMERAGVHAVRMTPQQNPLEALRVSMMLQLIPAPETEADAISRMLEAFPNLVSGSIDEAIDTYDTIELCDPLRRELIANYEVKIWLDPNRSHPGSTTPFFCRLLSGTASIDGFRRHLETLFRFDEDALEVIGQDFELIPLGTLRDLLDTEGARRAHRAWIDQLDLPEFGFVRFVQHFWDQWATPQEDYAVCIVIDQFEEIFTRFTDLSGRDDDEDFPGDEADQEAGEFDAKPDWQLRPNFFSQLNRLLTDSDASGSVLPVSVVLSMRDEFLGQLRAVAELRRLWEGSQYRLDFIDKRDVAGVIREPAKAYGYDYDEECYARIRDDLLREERFVEPAHIQIVCEKLWDELGQKLHEAAVDSGDFDNANRVINLKTFLDVTGGPRQILRNHFGDTLNQLSESDQIEVMDMLAPLLTSQGTRNVAVVDDLVNAPLRDPFQREELLRYLQGRNIVRIEARLGGYFAEITHEFLLKPIQAEMAQRATDKEQSFRFALRALAAAHFGSVRESEMAVHVSEPVLRILLSQHTRVRWRDWAVRLLVRAALRHGATREDYLLLGELYSGRSTAFRPSFVESLVGGDPRPLSDWIEMRHREEAWLNLDELATMQAHVVPALKQDEELRQRVTEMGLVSALHRAGPDETDIVRLWTGIAQDHQDAVYH